MHKNKKQGLQDLKTMLLFVQFLVVCRCLYTTQTIQYIKEGGKEREKIIICVTCISGERNFKFAGIDYGTSGTGGYSVCLYS